jgi:polar amino acid transport system substrate-binding protein
MNRPGTMLTRFVLILGLVLSCGTQADTLNDILDRGKIRIGVSLFTPWAMKDKTGQLAGFEVEVAKRLAEEMGVEPEFKVYTWVDIIAALNSDEIDVIIAGMSITPKRALQMNFTLPYAESGASLVTNTAMTKQIEDLRGLNRPQVIVAAAAKTLGSDVAKLVFDQADLRIMASHNEAKKALLAGKVHAYVADTTRANFLALEHADRVDMPLTKPLLVSVTGMGVKKGEQELLNFLNSWITARAADKWLSATQKYWFNSLKWREAVGQ